MSSADEAARFIEIAAAETAAGFTREGQQETIRLSFPEVEGPDGVQALLATGRWKIKESSVESVTLEQITDPAPADDQTAADTEEE